MRLTSITANLHVFGGQVSGRPIQLRLNIAGAPSLRLQVAGDGERMRVDEGPLDDPFDMGEHGRVDVADMTDELCPHLRDAELIEIVALTSRGARVGLRLHAADRPAFHIWVDCDELHWGDEAAFAGHAWLDGVVPEVGGR